jgi:hypothetical protein
MQMALRRSTLVPCTHGPGWVWQSCTLGTNAALARFVLQLDMTNAAMSPHERISESSH